MIHAFPYSICDSMNISKIEFISYMLVALTVEINVCLNKAVNKNNPALYTREDCYVDIMQKCA